MKYIGYGIGYYYEAVKNEIKNRIKLDYLCDKKWDNEDIEQYDGIPIIKRCDLDTIEEKTIVIFSCNGPLISELTIEFSQKGYSYLVALDIIGNKMLTGIEIKQEGNDGVYNLGSNIIYYDETLPDNINIYLTGVNTETIIGKNLIIDTFLLVLGNNCKCSIGNDVRIVGVEAHVAYANLEIGDDCLFAKNVILRTHDAHHIFDRKTGKRINYAKDVIISPQVWVAEGAKLLPGASVGTGTIVAANTVTSSKFIDHVIIAGDPAKIIREDIIWSKDNTQFASYDYFNECISDDAKKYF